MIKDEEYIDLDFGEVVHVKGNGIKSITVDDNYIFTIHYTDGTTQTIPTTYRDFKNVLDQLTAANTDAKKQIDDISQKISEADEKKVEVAECAQNALSEIESKGENILTSTLSASGWTGTEAPYQYDLSTITSFKICTIGFDSSTGTDDQLKAAQSANIHGGSGASIYAYGTKPDIDIPIVIEQSNFGTAAGIVASFSGGGGGDGFSIVQIPKVTGTSFAYTGSAQ